MGMGSPARTVVEKAEVQPQWPRTCAQGNECAQRCGRCCYTHAHTRARTHIHTCAVSLSSCFTVNLPRRRQPSFEGLGGVKTRAELRRTQLRGSLCSAPPPISPAHRAPPRRAWGPGAARDPRASPRGEGAELGRHGRDARAHCVDPGNFCRREALPHEGGPGDPCIR